MKKQENSLFKEIRYALESFYDEHYSKSFNLILKIEKRATNLKTLAKLNKINCIAS